MTDCCPREATHRWPKDWGTSTQANSNLLLNHGLRVISKLLSTKGIDEITKIGYNNNLLIIARLGSDMAIIKANSKRPFVSVIKNAILIAVKLSNWLLNCQNSC